MVPPRKGTLDLTQYKNKYRGRHREFDMDSGCGFIPHGDRNRVKPEFVEVEERDSDPNIRRI